MDIIRRDTDYAVRGLSYLARLKHGGATCAKVARSCDIPKSFAYKLLRKLADAGLVESRPGRSGGFRLRGATGEISLGAVVEAVQGKLSVSRCVTTEDACARRRSCGLRVEWSELQKRMMEFLDHVTLLEVLKISSRPRARKTKGARHVRPACHESRR